MVFQVCVSVHALLYTGTLGEAGIECTIMFLIVFAWEVGAASQSNIYLQLIVRMILCLRVFLLSF